MPPANRPVVLVLGATGAVGSTLCTRLRGEGASVVAAGRDSDRLRALADELDCPAGRFDADDSDSIGKCFDLTIDRFGKIDGVAHCVGSLLLKPAHTTTDGEWRETLETNLFSAFAVMRASAKAMRENGGAVVFVSSAAARIGLANHEAIAAAKAGIVGLTLSAAATYAARNIRVNAVAPGLVKSNMTRRLWESEAAAAASQEMHALGRLGEPDDVASIIQWLLSRENSWVTGQVISVDGGLSCVRAKQRQK